MKSPTPNPYEVLGVPKGATEEQIKDAYKTKIKAAHPDVGGNEDECKRLNAAYEILSDPEKKQAFDNPQPTRAYFNNFDVFMRHAFGGDSGGSVHFNMGQNGAFTFQRQQIIQCEGVMTLPQMLFGDKNYEVNSPVGKMKFELPPMSEPGKVFHIRVKKDEHGETIVQLRMTLRMPQNLTTEQITTLKNIS